MAPDLELFLTERARLLETAVPGPAAARELSDLTDRAVSELAEAALCGLAAPWTVLALGGWGARRLLPHSDLDLLVITNAAAEQLRPALAALLYPLWDAGLKVGHQVRTTRDHARVVRDDLETLTATITGRVLCGDDLLGRSVLDTAAAGARKRSATHLAALSDRPRPGSPYLLEPELKEGAGGQRDLDEIVWSGSVLTGRPADDPASALDAGLIDAHELERLRRAGDTITAARWALGARSARPTALLTLEVGADSGLDLEGLQAALANVHHTLLRVRARARGRATAYDPRGGDAVPLEPRAVFGLLDRGEAALPELEEGAWSGLLDDLVPAFGELLHARRPALSHIYTVGAHSLRTAVSVAGAPGADAADRRVLQVAALLHDVGKTQRGPGHPERGELAVRTLGRRFGLDEAQVADAATLVREHLLLAETATSRDLHSEDVILQTAARVPRADLVDGLHALTVADSLATGPGAWTPWHAALVGELASRVTTALAEDSDAGGLAARAEATRTAASAHVIEPAARAFVDRASVRYLSAQEPRHVVEDARLLGQLASSEHGSGAVASGVAPGPTEGTWRVSVAASDAPGLFATICGALSLTGLDIRGAETYEGPEGTALDVFIVQPDTARAPGTATWAEFDRILVAALRDPSGLAARLTSRRSQYPAAGTGRTLVETMPTGAYATALQIRTPDRIGLLYDVARAIADVGLRITWARAVSRDGIAHDTFHVTDDRGEPIADPGAVGHAAMRIREYLERSSRYHSR